MKVLVCDDDRVALKKTELLLQKMGHEILPFQDSHEALVALTSPNPPKLAVLDWMMPKFSGLDICRRVRANSNLISIYIIILTAKDQPDDLAEAFEAGANDFIRKPVEPIEFRARVTAGTRIVSLESELKTLTGLLPICAWCKKIRLEDQDWMKIEEYVENNSYATFSHGGCPDCLAKLSGE
jgi:phosphoserine phosphatase RsbU/P